MFNEADRLHDDEMFATALDKYRTIVKKYPGTREAERSSVRIKDLTSLGKTQDRAKP
jgi:hypothetical protein